MEDNLICEVPFALRICKRPFRFIKSSICLFLFGCNIFRIRSRISNSLVFRKKHVLSLSHFTTQSTYDFIFNFVRDESYLDFAFKWDGEFANIFSYTYA
jgi:hypothetical protein